MVVQTKPAMKLLLLHGAGLGAWIWKDVLPHLDVEAHAVDLPGRTNPAGITLEQCVDLVAKKLSSETVVVGHSIGAEAPRREREAEVAGRIHRARRGG